MTKTQIKVIFKISSIKPENKDKFGLTIKIIGKNVPMYLFNTISILENENTNSKNKTIKKVVRCLTKLGWSILIKPEEAK